MKREKISKVFEITRTAYITLYLTFIALMEVISFCNIINATNLPSMIYNFLAVFGGVLLLSDFCFKGVLFKHKYAGIIVLFFAAMVFSIIANMKYGFGDNLKTLVWSAIQIFLVAMADFDAPKKDIKLHFRIVTEWLSAVFSLGTLCSLCMFVIRHGVWVLTINDSTAGRREGFVEGRLFGVFTDPNYAAIASFAVLVFSIIWLIIDKNVFSKIYHGVLAFINYSYVVLSASRTVEIGFYLVLGILAFWCLFVLLKNKKSALKWALSILGGALGLVLAVALFAGTVKLYSYVPVIYENLTASANTAAPGADGEASSDTEVLFPEDKPVNMTRPDVENSTNISNNRTTIWGDYIKVFTKSFITGTSPRNYLQYAGEHFPDLYVVSEGYSIHNGYLSLFVCTGLIGGLLAMAYLVLIVIEIISYIIKKRDKVDNNYIIVCALTLALVVFAISGLSYQMIFFNNLFATVLFWAVIGYTRLFVRISSGEEVKETWLYKTLNKVKAKIFKKA